MAVYDEAGAEQEARKTQEYKKKMESVRRQAFDATFKASKSINTPLPTFPLKCSYTDVRISTPKAWASAMHGADATAGDARRVLEFWMDSKEAPDGARLQSIANAFFRTKSMPRPSGVGAVKGYMDFVVADGALELDGLHSSSALDTVRGLQEAGCSPDFSTIVCNIATATAYASGYSDVIPRESILAAWAVYFGVLENRQRLSDTDDASPLTQESQITKFVLDYIGARGSVRKSSVSRMLKQHGASFVRAFNELVSNGLIVPEKAPDGKSTTVRLATDAEIEAADASKDKMPDFSEERANRDKVARNNAERAFEAMQAAEYANETVEGKLAKLEAYRREHEKEPGHEIVRGQRDPSLRSLATKLHNAGMDDAFAEAWFFELCDGLGDEFARESTKRRLWRPAPRRT